MANAGALTSSGQSSAPVPAQDTTTWFAGFGFRIELMGGIGPGPVLGPRVFAELELERESVWSPALRLSAARAESSKGLSEFGSTADFSWKAGRLEGCPLRLRLADDVAVRPCLAAELGVLEAGLHQGAEIVEASSEQRLWASLQAVLRIRWTIVEYLVIEADAGLTLPVFRDDFVITRREDARSLYSVPAVAAFAGVGIGVALPVAK